jgi:hypothetical protein
VRITAIVLAAALLATVSVASACGHQNTPTPQVSTTTGGTTSYSNDQYGFSFKIADRFEQAATDKNPMGSPPDFEVIFRDPDGTKQGGVSVDAFDVSVNKMDQQITPNLLRKEKAQVEAAFREAESQTTDLVWTTPVETSINGVPGWTVDYSHAAGDTALKERAYVLYKGDKSYTLTLQSAAATWPDNEPDLQAAAESFTIE